MTTMEVMTFTQSIQEAAHCHNHANDLYAHLIAEGMDEDAAAETSGLESTSDAVMEQAQLAWNGNDLLAALHAVRDVVEVGLPVADEILNRIADRYVGRTE